jgi:hypothetical protein
MKLTPIGRRPRSQFQKQSNRQSGCIRPRDFGLPISEFAKDVDGFDIATRKERRHLADRASQVFGGDVLHRTASRNQRSPIPLQRTARCGDGSGRGPVPPLEAG